MRDMLEVQSLMINSNFFGWLLPNLSIAILFASLDVVLFVKIFKSRVSKWQIITGIATESIARIVINSVIPFPYNRAIILVLTVMIFKFVLNEKIEKVQTKYEQIQAVTTAEDDLMKDVKTVEKNAEEVNILKRMTRNIAEIFVEEITIYDSEKIEVKFVFDDLLVDMANRIEKKKEGIA